MNGIDYGRLRSLTVRNLISQTGVGAISNWELYGPPFGSLESIGKILMTPESVLRSI